MFRKTTLIVTMLVAVALCACFAACNGGAFDPASASPREIVDEVRGFFAGASPRRSLRPQRV